MTIYELADRFPGGKWRGDEYDVSCPAHDDRHASLSLSSSPEGKLLLCCQAGCDSAAVLARQGLSWSDLRNGNARPPEETVYRYDDEAGNPLYEIVRTADKRFLARLPGTKIYKIEGVRRVLYGLPELLRTKPGETVGIAEGEKDVATLRRHGIAATTNPGGASQGRSKWRQDYTDWLRDHLPGRRFAIFADNDAPGHEHAAAVLASLKGAGLDAFLVQMEGLGAKEDVSDWAARHTTEELQALLVPQRHPLDLKVIEGPALQAMKLPEPEAVIPNLLYRGFSTLIAGDSKLGKSSLVLRGLLASAAGGWWLDTKRQPETRLPESRILYINFEDPLVLTQWRARRMMDPEPLPKNFLTMEPPYGFRLQEVADWIAGAHERLELDAVILDPIAIAAEWEEETNNSEVGRTFKMLQRLAAETRLAILSAHHVTKKPGQRGLSIRGGSAIKANVMGYLVLEWEQGGIRLSGINKWAGEWDITLDRRERDYSWWITESRAGSTAVPRNAQRHRSLTEIMSTLAERPGLTTEALAAMLGVHRRTCLRYLQELQSGGHVHSIDQPTGPDGGRPTAVWSRSRLTLS